MPTHTSRTARPAIRRHADPATRQAGMLLDSLWAGRAPQWVTPLSSAPTAPTALRDLVAGPTSTLTQALTATPVAVSDATQRWSSGGNDGSYSPDNEQITEHFRDIFNTIRDQMSRRGTPAKLSKEDLFHAHLFHLGPHQGAPHGELGMVFHLKEYPCDLEPFKGKNADFTSRDKAYRDRNVLYLMSTDRLYIVRPPTNHPSESLLSGKAEWDQMAPSLRSDLLRNLGGPSYRAGYALSPAPFVALGEALPDLNLLPVDLDSPRSADAVFLTPDLD